MMKSRLMKGRPRLVPKEDYQASSVNLWIEDKESDITSVSSASSDESEDSENDSMMSYEELDETADHDDEDSEDEDDEDEDGDESAMEHTLEPILSENTKESHAQFNEVTPLYKAIDGEEWDSVLAFLETGSWGWKWSSLCAQLYQVTEKPVDAQVRTWVSATMKDSKNVSSRLPLHAAIAKEAPYKIVEALVMHHSKGARNPDSEGNYALHLAFENGADIETLTFLMKEFPEAVHISNEKGKVPTECGSAKGLAEIVQLGIDATKKKVESELTKEKGNLEEDRKQLLEVTKELMNLKKIVAERERNMTKDNFLYQKQHLNSAISQLTRLKTDLDKHEDNVLQHHLVAEKKRMDGVLGELQKTKGELEMIKSEKNLGSDPEEMISSPPVQHPKKKKSKKSKKTAAKVVEKESKPAPAPAPEEEATATAAATATAVATAAAAAKERDETVLSDEAAALTSPRDAPSDVWQETSLLSINTADQQQYGLDESRHGESTVASPSSDKGGSRSPKKMKNVAARFKKKMNWRKEKQLLAAENE